MCQRSLWQYRTEYQPKPNTPNEKVLALRSLEALAKVANGKATKIIIPSDLQNLGGVVPSIKELMTDPKDAE